MKLKTLNDAYPNGFIGEGVFQNMTNPPWAEMFDSDDLDLQFFSEYGNKPIAPILEHFMTETGLTDEVRTRISRMLLNRFKTQWEHKYQLLLLEYNPIENYSMIETGEDKNSGSDVENIEQVESNKQIQSGSDTETITDTTTTNRTETDEMTDADEGTDTKTNNRNTNNSVNAFNSTDAVPTEAGTETISENVARNNTRTVNDERTITNSDNRNSENNKTTSLDNQVDITRSDDRTRTSQNTLNHTLTRSGNIGVTTSQQMAQSEIDLWNWNFISDVFKDIVSVLTLPIYDVWSVVYD